MKVLVWDSGIGFCYALKFILEGNKVYYFIDKWDPFQNLNFWAIGQGIENLIRIFDVYEALDKVDFIFFTDVGRGATIDYLKKKIPVFGAPKKAEFLELRKSKFYSFLQANGLPVTETYYITGIHNVLSFFKQHKGQWYLKIDMPFRGSLKTTLINDYEEASIILETIENEIMPLKEEINFIIQKRIDGYYVGCDCFLFHGEFYPEILFGYELEENTVSRWLPYKETVFYKAINVFQKFFSQIDYCGCFSLEGIYDGDKLYLIDPTIRPAYPTSSAMLCQNISNFTNFLINNINGKFLKLERNSEYTGGFIVTSEYSNKLLKINIKKGSKFWPKRLFVKNNLLYIPPTDEPRDVIGVIVGEGKSYEEVFKDIDKQADKISCYGIQFILNFHDFRTHIKETKNLGIIF